jgi:hypothetical protein
MAEAGFDIRTLQNFTPVSFLCQKCMGLLSGWPVPRGQLLPTCPVCSVQYLPAPGYTKYEVDRFLKDQGLHLELNDVLAQCKALAGAVTSFPWDGQKSQMRSVLGAMSTAKILIHFISFGIDAFFLGALKLAAQRVPVRGIAANIDERVLDELTAFADDAPSGNFQVRHFIRDGMWREAPHQKLLVIDGLIAFKGSANLTTMGWRKADRGLDHVEIVTRVGDVIDLHNRLFAPIWADRSGIGSAIEMKSSF